MAVLDTLLRWFRRGVTEEASEGSITSEQERLRRFRRAWDAYYGRYPQPLKVKRGKPDDNVIINFARVVVDKGVSFLFGREVGFELDETQETDAEAWLAECWDINRKMALLQRVALNGAVCGHAFVKIVPRQLFPRVVALDPSIVTVRWDPHDYEQVNEYEIRYIADLEENQSKEVRQLILRDGPSWRIVDQERRLDSDVWVTLKEEIWPYPWPPVVDCQNLPVSNDYWGLSDLSEDMLRLNGSINFVLSNLVRIVRYHAHPRTWGRGFSVEQMRAAADETIVLPEGGELRNLEMISDLSSSIALYERLREALHEITRVPEVATGKLDRAGALSGVALNILYQPLLEKTETKRRTYGDMLVELNRRLLVLGGFGEDNHTMIHWPELLPGDPRAEAETALLQQQLGVSADTLLERMGFDPDLERQKREVAAAALGEQMLTAFEHGE